MVTPLKKKKEETAKKRGKGKERKKREVAKKRAKRRQTLEGWLLFG